MLESLPYKALLSLETFGNDVNRFLEGIEPRHFDFIVFSLWNERSCYPVVHNWLLSKEDIVRSFKRDFNTDHMEKSLVVKMLVLMCHEELLGVLKPCKGNCGLEDLENCLEAKQAAYCPRVFHHLAFAFGNLMENEEQNGIGLVSLVRPPDAQAWPAPLPWAVEYVANRCANSMSK